MQGADVMYGVHLYSLNAGKILKPETLIQGMFQAKTTKNKQKLQKLLGQETLNWSSTVTI